MDRLEGIEKALLTDPSVETCMVIRRETGPGTRQVVAYLTPAGRVVAGSLHAHLECCSPVDLLPDAYVALETLPFGPDGRIDEQRLLDLRATDAQVVWVARPKPRSRTNGPWVRATQHPASPRPHPLLGKRLWSPALSDAVFEASVSLETAPLLGDHRCCDIPVAPGAYYLTLATAAAQRALGLSQCDLEDVAFARALVLPDAEEHTLQLILSFGDGLGEFFKVVSCRNPPGGDEDAWTVHATGSVARPPAEPATTAGLSPDARSRLMQGSPRVSGVALYEAMQRHHVQIGPGSRAIQSAWIGEEQLLCQLHLPETVEGFRDFPVHPLLLDACVHVLGGARPYDAERTLIPTGVTRFRFLAPPETGDLWCHVHIRRGDGEEPSADACLFEDDGRLVAALEGITYQQVPREVLAEVLGGQLAEGSRKPARIEFAKPHGDFVAALEQAPAGERRSTVLRLVHDVAGELLGLDSTDAVGPDEGFFDAGMDSLRVVRMSTRLSEILGCSLPSTLAFKFSTVGQLAAHLCDEVLKLGAAEGEEAQWRRRQAAPGAAAVASLDEFSEDELLDRLAAKLASIEQGNRG